MNSERLMNLLVNALGWAVNVSETVTHDIVKYTGITSEELTEIGFDIADFPDMHKAAKEK